MLHGLAELEAQERKVLAATSELHEVWSPALRASSMHDSFTFRVLERVESVSYRASQPQCVQTLAASARPRSADTVFIPGSFSFCSLPAPAATSLCGSSGSRARSSSPCWRTSGGPQIVIVALLCSQGHCRLPPAASTRCPLCRKSRCACSFRLETCAQGGGGQLEGCGGGAAGDRLLPAPLGRCAGAPPRPIVWCGCCRVYMMLQWCHVTVLVHLLDSCIVPPLSHLCDVAVK